MARLYRLLLYSSSAEVLAAAAATVGSWAAHDAPTLAFSRYGGLERLADLQLNSGSSAVRQAAAEAHRRVSVAAMSAAKMGLRCAVLMEQVDADKRVWAAAAAKAAKRQRKKEQQQQQQQAAAEAVVEQAAAEAVVEQAAAEAVVEQAAAEAVVEQAAVEAAATLAAAEPLEAGRAAASEPAEAVSSPADCGSSTLAAQQQKPRRRHRHKQAASSAMPAAAAALAQLDEAPASRADALEQLQHLGLSDGPAAAAPEPAGAGKQQTAATGRSRRGGAGRSSRGGVGRSSGGGVGSSGSAPPPLLDLQALADLCCCPITCAPFQHPVTAADGGTYERHAIEAWIARELTAGRQPASPLTGAPLATLHLHRSLAVRSLVAALQAAGQLQH